VRLLRKNDRDRVPERVTDALTAVRESPHRGTLLTTALIVGGAAALTAGSAAISSLRRRVENS
jgi:hypothetical protein